ncbi:MAG TPA: GNAT family N-acetyltransferase [Dongiaceae bacterium]|jgi:acetyltransferase|nr:GNAT family N-acetyltransferase [Dongiaceae bacterium]
MIGMEPGRNRFLVREWRPSDRRRQDAFLQRLDREDLRMRFGLVRRPPELLVPAFTAARPGAAFAALDSGRALLGIATLIAIDGASAELAVIVRSDRKRRGLGRALIAYALCWAARHGLACVVGYVLAENHPMLALARAMDFRCVRNDPFLVEVSRPSGCRSEEAP